MKSHLECSDLVNEPCLGLVGCLLASDESRAEITANIFQQFMANPYLETRQRYFLLMCKHICKIYMAFFVGLLSLAATTRARKQRTSWSAKNSSATRTSDKKCFKSNVICKTAKNTLPWWSMTIFFYWSLLYYSFLPVEASACTRTAQWIQLWQTWKNDKERRFSTFKLELEW